MKSRKVPKKARIFFTSYYIKDGKRRIPFSSFNFSEVEDSPDAFNVIKEIAESAGKSAATEAMAAGLSNIFVRDNQIIRLYPNGEEEVVVTDLPKGYKFYVKYKPGTVFHGRKK